MIHFEERRLDRIFAEVKEVIPLEETILLTPSTVYGVIPQSDLPSRPHQVARENYSVYPAQPGDFVISMSSFLHGFEYCGIMGGISPDYTLLRPNFSESIGRFLKYSLKSDVLVQQLGAFRTGIRQGQRLTWNKIRYVKIPFPDEDSAKNIADFLDCETARIDQLIEKKVSFSKILLEKIKSKADEIEFLSIDGHQVRLRHHIKLNPGKSEVRHLSGDTTVSFLPMEAINDGFGGINELAQTKSLDDVAGSYTYFAEGDVLLAKVTPCFENGKKALAMGLENGIGFGTSELHVLRITKDLVPDYLLLLLSTSRFKANGCISMTGAGGLKRVSERAILDFRFHLPSKEKQHDISSKIRSEIEPIESIINKTNQSIVALQRFRTSLITEAVTGQLDIKAWKKKGGTDKRLDNIEAEIVDGNLKRGAAC